MSLGDITPSPNRQEFVTYYVKLGWTNRTLSIVSSSAERQSAHHWSLYCLVWVCSHLQRSSGTPACEVQTLAETTTLAARHP